MIINIKNKEDLITLDFKLKQIRYLKKFNDKKEIIFININSSTTESLIYLYENPFSFQKSNDENFLMTIRDLIKEELNLNINLNDLEILK